MLRAFAWVGLAITLLGVAGGLAVRAVRPAPFPPSPFGIGGTTVVALAVLAIAWSAVGALLVTRRPENPIGRMMIVVGTVLGMAVLFAAIAVAALAEKTATGLAVASVAGALGALGTPALVLLYYVPFIFPTGHAHTPAWDRIGRTCLIADLAISALVLLHPGDIHVIHGIPNPVGFGPDFRPVLGPNAAVGLSALTAGLTGPVVLAALASRFAAAGPIERQQLKWFVLGTVVAVAGGGTVVVAAVLGSGTAAETLSIAFALSGTSIPISIGIGILRYRLYDIDRIISRTIAWAAVSAGLVCVYVGSILVLQAPLSAMTNGESLAVAASTLLVAALFQPVRHRIATIVDRRFNRARYDAERTTAAFADRVRNEVDLGALAFELEGTVRATMEPRSLALWLRHH